MAYALVTLKISHVFVMIIVVLINILSENILILLKVNNILITDVLIFVLITVILTNVLSGKIELRIT